MKGKKDQYLSATLMTVDGFRSEAGKNQQISTSYRKTSNHFLIYCKIIWLGDTNIAVAADSLQY